MALQQKHVFPSQDSRLDWVSKHDSRSLEYLIAEKLGTVEIVPKRWHSTLTLDQSHEGACVGFGWTQELLTSPRPFTSVTAVRANAYASGYYRECLQNDEYPGEEDNGTSVLAGAQTAVRRNFIGEYRWCTSLEDIRDTVIKFGPVVIGIPWYEDMYVTDRSGLVRVGGPVVGGHCLLVDEYHPAKQLHGVDGTKEVFGWHNSWGPDYGLNGRGYVEFNDLGDLLKNYGEACAPLQRKLVRF